MGNELKMVTKDKYDMRNNIACKPAVSSCDQHRYSALVSDATYYLEMISPRWSTYSTTPSPSVPHQWGIVIV